MQFYMDEDEARQILTCVVAISVAFTIINFGGIDAFFVLLKYPKNFVFFTAISVVTVGTGFILHELAHKIVAIYYGAHARFQMWVQGLMLMFLTSLFGFLFAAPGAVYIYSTRISKRENGIISIAGPFTNIILAAVFVVLDALNNATFRGLPIWELGAQINIILAMFNMLPISPLDGSKVFLWNKLVWGGFVAMSLLFGYLVFGSLGIVFMFLLLLIISLAFSRVLF